jgi:hypothetical protein
MQASDRCPPVLPSRPFSFPIPDACALPRASFTSRRKVSAASAARRHHTCRRSLSRRLDPAELGATRQLKCSVSLLRQRQTTRTPDWRIRVSACPNVSDRPSGFKLQDNEAVDVTGDPV